MFIYREHLCEHQLLSPAPRSHAVDGSCRAIGWFGIRVSAVRLADGQHESELDTGTWPVDDFRVPWHAHLHGAGRCAFLTQLGDEGFPHFDLVYLVVEFSDSLLRLNPPRLALILFHPQEVQQGILGRVASTRSRLFP